MMGRVSFNEVKWLPGETWETGKGHRGTLMIVFTLTLDQARPRKILSFQSLSSLSSQIFASCGKC
jgi:hypothetical protein